MKTLDEYKKAVEKAVKDILTETSGENIPARVRHMLDSRHQDIIAKLLGMSDHWNRWEVDHCNGRVGESAAGDWLRAQAGSGVAEWLTAQAGNLPELPKSAIKSLRSEYLNTLERLVRVELTSRAEAEARRQVEAILADITDAEAE